MSFACQACGASGEVEFHFPGCSYVENQNRRTALLARAVYTPRAEPK